MKNIDNKLDMIIGMLASIWSNVSENKFIVVITAILGLIFMLKVLFDTVSKKNNIE